MSSCGSIGRWADFCPGSIDSVGAGNYVVAMSADHGVSPIAERQRSQGLDGGRIAPVTLEQSADQTLQRVFGPGKYVSRVVNGDVYLAAGVFDRLVAKPAALDSVRRSLTDIPGVAAVFTRDRVAAKQVRDEPLGQRVMNSFDSERSGDFIVVVKPYWTIRTTGTGHGSPYGFDTRVPIVLMGKGIAPGKHLAPVSPLDIAPTLAFLAGVTLPRAEGHVLREAFVVTPRRPVRFTGREPPLMRLEGLQIVVVERDIEVDAGRSGSRFGTRPACGAPAGRDLPRCHDRRRGLRTTSAPRRAILFRLRCPGGLIGACNRLLVHTPRVVGILSRGTSGLGRALGGLLRLLQLQLRLARFRLQTLSVVDGLFELLFGSFYVDLLGSHR